jgi:hypothetical protein
MVELTLSVWPSVSRCHMVDIWGFIPIAIRNAYQDIDVTRESHYQTMSVSFQCNIYILRANSSARFSALFSFFLNRILNDIFVKQSIITQVGYIHYAEGHLWWNPVQWMTIAYRLTLKATTVHKTYALPHYFFRHWGQDWIYFTILSFISGHHKFLCIRSVALSWPI